jgi:DNA-binding NarL/FixJ family response regulator
MLGEMEIQNHGTVAAAPRIDAAPVAEPLSLLTPREMQVLRLMADGLTTKEIAEQLNVRFKTAACHRFRLLQKLNVTSTVTAVRWAIRAGIVEP